MNQPEPASIAISVISLKPSRAVVGHFEDGNLVTLRPCQRFRTERFSFFVAAPVISGRLNRSAQSSESGDGGGCYVPKTKCNSHLAIRHDASVERILSALAHDMLLELALEGFDAGVI